MDEHTDNQFPAVVEGSIGGAAIQTVNGRDLHRFLEVGRDFSNWMKARIDHYGFVQGVDFEVFAGIGENSSGGRPSKEYVLTLDMGKELGMVENNERGRQVRRYFMECERRAHQPLNLDDPSVLRSLLLQNVEKVERLEARVEADKPKVGFYDRYVNADGLYGFQNAGRALECQPNLFTRWLKQDYVFYQGTALVPRVRYIQMGIFEVKSEIVDDKVRPRSWITAKGLEYFSKRVPDTIRMRRAA
ncbi:MAG: phage antirepressor Ant [Mesorhizobium amorphae]|nr:MAG: phage antirepressor Ant [Mesorhizobium amorphae]